MPHQENYQKSLSLRNRLQIFFIAVAIIPALTISIWAIAMEYKTGRQQAVDRLQSTSTLIDLEFASWLKGMQGELSVPLSEEFGYERAETLLTLGEKADNYFFYTKALRNRLRFYVSQSQQLQEIYLLNLDGVTVLSTDESQEGRLFTKNLQELNPICVIENDTIFVLNSIYSEDGQLMGALAGGVKLDKIITILNVSNSLGQTGKAYLVNDQILPEVSSIGVSIEQTLWSEQLSSINASRMGIGISNDLDDYAAYKDYKKHLVIGFYHWIPEIQMGLLIEQDLLKAFETLFFTMAVSLGVVFVAIILAVTVSWLITREIARPIEDLALAANRIANGNLEQTVQVEKKDEIGVLSDAFNSMTTQLRNLINSLEMRVEERTRDLKQRALQLETSVKVSREVSSILDINVLLTRVVELISDTFGYYHTSIYLVDEVSHQLVFQAGTDKLFTTDSLSGAQVSSVNHESIRKNAPVLLSDTSKDDRFIADSTMKETRSELVIPLRVGENTIGTLDVQSREVNAFTSEDVLVIQSLGDQIAIAIENARLYKRNGELAILQERNRLARDLHDSVSQSLYSLSLMAEGWKRLVKSGKEGNLENYANRFAEITQQALKEMRLLIYEMRSPALDQEGLIGALRQRLDAVEQHAGIETQFIVDELISLPEPIEEMYYWIAQESLNNALKHANASQVNVHFYIKDSKIILDISDNGIGFDMQSSARNYGLGLSTMYERAEKINSFLIIESYPGKGTTISIQVPVKENLTVSKKTSTEKK